ncbi:Serine/threonine-protein kinase 32C [Plecturocebus cupreus]
MQSRALSRALHVPSAFSARSHPAPSRRGGARRLSRAPGLRNPQSAEAPVASGPLGHVFSGQAGVARTGRGCPRARAHVLRAQRPPWAPACARSQPGPPAPPSGAALGAAGGLLTVSLALPGGCPADARRPHPSLQPVLTLRKAEGRSLRLFSLRTQGEGGRGDREKVLPPCRAELSRCQGRRPPGPRHTRGGAPCLHRVRPRRLVGAVVPVFWRTTAPIPRLEAASRSRATLGVPAPPRPRPHAASALRPCHAPAVSSAPTPSRSSAPAPPRTSASPPPRSEAPPLPRPLRSRAAGRVPPPRRAHGGRCGPRALPPPLLALRAGHARCSGRGAHPGPAMRSGAERRGSCAAAPPGSPPPGRARPSGSDAPPALQPPAVGQSRARDSGDARAQPRPLFAWSKWKKRMGSSMSAATARRPVFDDKEDGECGRGEGVGAWRCGGGGRGGAAFPRGVHPVGRRPGAPRLPEQLHASPRRPPRPPFPVALPRAEQAGRGARGARVSGLREPPPPARRSPRSVSASWDPLARAHVQARLYSAVRRRSPVRSEAPAPQVAARAAARPGPRGDRVVSSLGTAARAGGGAWPLRSECAVRSCRKSCQARGLVSRVTVQQWAPAEKARRGDGTGGPSPGSPT